MLNAFEFSEKCPHMCWQGINPGVTTTDEALALLKASDQIGQTSYIDDEPNKTLWLHWFTDKSKTFHTGVYLGYENGIVTSISFQNLYPFRIKDLISILGEPSEINITQEIEADAEFIRYSVFYPEQRIQIEVGGVHWNSPNPNDDVQSLGLNIEFYNPLRPRQKWIIQPWLGYGHLEDYLPGIRIPTNTNYTSP
jgi:hypothetical protein